MEINGVGGGEFRLERRDAGGAEEERGLGSFCLEDVFAGGHPGTGCGIEPRLFAGEDEASGFCVLFDDGGLEDVGAYEKLVVDFVKVFACEIVEEGPKVWGTGSLVGDEEVVEVGEELVSEPDVVGDVIAGGSRVGERFLGFGAVVAVVAGKGEQEVGLHPAFHEARSGISAESTDVGTVEDVAGEVHAEASGDAELQIEIVGDVVASPDGGIARGSGETRSGEDERAFVGDGLFESGECGHLHSEAVLVSVEVVFVVTVLEEHVGRIDGAGGGVVHVYPACAEARFSEF